MPIFRKKPVAIEAIQWDGTYSGIAMLLDAYPQLETLAVTHKDGIVSYWKIGTLEGGHEVTKGDWIIRGVKGEHYPCKPDVFALTYEPVEPGEQGEGRTCPICDGTGLDPDLPEYACPACGKASTPKDGEVQRG